MEDIQEVLGTSLLHSSHQGVGVEYDGEAGEGAIGQVGLISYRQ